MREKKKPISMRLEPNLLKSIDEVSLLVDIPNRTAFVEQACSEYFQKVILKI